MASMVSLESELRSVFTTQYTPPFCAKATTWSFVPLKKSL
jgi:hypothetical protein